MTEKYRSLVSLHQDKVYSLACYLLADASEAEDVCQEVYLKLWLNLDKVEGDYVGPWLLRVARNQCLDRLRARKVKLLELDDQALPIEENQEPANEIQHTQLQKQLLAAIHSMEEPSRSLLILRDIHEHSYESVAEILQLKANQVKVYLHRARKKLGELLVSVDKND